MESLNNKKEEQTGEVLNQKLEDIIQESRTKSAALKKILVGLENLNEKNKGSKEK